MTSDSELTRCLERLAEEVARLVEAWRAAFRAVVETLRPIVEAWGRAARDAVALARAAGVGPVPSRPAWQTPYGPPVRMRPT